MMLDTTRAEIVPYDCWRTKGASAACEFPQSQHDGLWLPRQFAKRRVGSGDTSAILPLEGKQVASTRKWIALTVP